MCGDVKMIKKISESRSSQPQSLENRNRKHCSNCDSPLNDVCKLCTTKPETQLKHTQPKTKHFYCCAHFSSVEVKDFLRTQKNVLNTNVV